MDRWAGRWVDQRVGLMADHLGDLMEGRSEDQRVDHLEGLMEGRKVGLRVDHLGDQRGGRSGGQMEGLRMGVKAAWRRSRRMETLPLGKSMALLQQGRPQAKIRALTA